MNDTAETITAQNTTVTGCRHNCSRLPWLRRRERQGSMGPGARCSDRRTPQGSAQGAAGSESEAGRNILGGRGGRTARQPVVRQNVVIAEAVLLSAATPGRISTFELTLLFLRAITMVTAREAINMWVRWSPSAGLSPARRTLTAAVENRRFSTLTSRIPTHFHCGDLGPVSASVRQTGARLPRQANLRDRPGRAFSRSS